jgi:hypothetical protein
MFRICQGTHGPITTVDAADEIESAVRARGPGYYSIDAIRSYAYEIDCAVPWGTAKHHPDGRVDVMERYFGDGIATPKLNLEP